MPDPILDLVPDAIRHLAAYQVPRIEGVRAKLDANEFPLPLPPAHAAELGQVLARVPLNRYPAADCGPLRDAIARHLSIPGDQLVFGNGSDELIQLVINAFTKPRSGAHHALVMYPTPSFIWFRLATLGAGAEPLEIPLDAEFALDVDRIRRNIVRNRPNIAFFARPNNPTGTLWPSETIAGLAREFPDVLFVSDEAYAEYCGDSMIALVPRLPNLAVMRTFSKVGLAGLRVGTLYASPAVTGELEKVRPPYNVGALNQAALLWMFERHPELLSSRCAEVVAERQRLHAGLERIPGVLVYPSQANLILIRVGDPGDGRAGHVWMALRDRGVLIRNFDRPGPLAGCLRITVGTGIETDILLAELRAIQEHI
jgi:histidinol-phosphate aminotransferase